jgi:hypothetical protein
MFLLNAGTDGSNRTQITIEQPTGQIAFVHLAGGTVTLNLTSTPVYRDPSAWYHIVVAADTTQATSSERAKIYINGVQLTAFSSSQYWGQNTDSFVDATNSHMIGRYIASASNFFDGYMTEINFIDGQALTPSSFGETSTTTGVWIPKKYAGTYGTNGFYLPFTDNSALTTSSNVGLGRDYSGNGNYWTTNNISITAGVTYDSMTDVPTLTSATTANYCVLNPLRPASYGNGTITNGNLTFSQAAAAYVSTNSNIYMDFGSGKWYWEVTCVTAGFVTSIGISNVPSANGITTGIATYHYDGSKYLGASNSAYGASYTSGDVLGFAYDATIGSLTAYKNGVSQGVLASGLTGTYFAYATLYGTNNLGYNFGQRPWVYSAPTGFLPLNTFNLPTPTIGASASTLANKNFDATTYTGNGTTQNIVNAGGFQPDYVWVKCRSSAKGNINEDSVRGAGKLLSSESTAAESGNTGDLIGSFNSNGFQVNLNYLGGSNDATNQNGGTFVAWQWRANGAAVTNTAGTISSQVSANTSAGFSVVTYTGTGANATVGHGLGVAPRMVIVKNRVSAGNSWCTWHIGLTSAAFSVFLDSTGAQGNFPTIWNSTAPTSSVFSVGSATGTNGSTNGMVAYCFAQIAGYSAFGSYTANGSTDGPFVFTGFRPRFVLIKWTNTESWYIFDTARGTSNVIGPYLVPNTSAAEATFTAIDILSNGFKLRDANNFVNSSGTYIYAAFAESPFKYANAR